MAAGVSLRFRWLAAISLTHSFAPQAVAEIINADRERMDQLEAAKVVFPEEHEREPAPRGRKSVGGTKSELKTTAPHDTTRRTDPAVTIVDGPTPEEAHEDFAKGKRAIDKLLKVRYDQSIESHPLTLSDAHRKCRSSARPRKERQRWLWMLPMWSKDKGVLRPSCIYFILLLFYPSVA